MSSSLRPYLKFFETRFQSLVQYRAAAWAGFVCQFFWGLIMIMVMQAFYRSSRAPQAPMSLAGVISYIWLGQAFLGMLPWNVDRDMMMMVEDGSLCYELLKPLDLHTYWFMRSLSLRFTTAFLRVLPQLIFSALILPLIGLDDWALTMPSHHLVYPVWIITVALALLLSASLTTVVNISLIWSISGTGTSQLVGALVTLFSGMVVPLPFYPDRWQKFLRYQPFHGLVDGPNRIFTGDIPLKEAPLEWGIQLFWILFFILAGRFLIRAGKKRLVVQGG
jgi:ABC-2 type transport system permease protein